MLDGLMLSSLIYFGGMVVAWVILVPKLSDMDEDFEPSSVTGAVLVGMSSLMLAMIWPALLGGIVLVAMVRFIVYRKIKGPWW
jgi:uncharacterized membrane protein